MVFDAEGKGLSVIAERPIPSGADGRVEAISSLKLTGRPLGEEVRSVEQKLVSSYGVIEEVERLHELFRRGVELSPRVKCPVCSQEVNVECLVAHIARNHVRMVGGSRECSICGRRAKSEVEYLKHLRDHFVYVVVRRGTRRWVCAICGRRFSGRRSVFVHLMKSHERCT